MTAREAFAELRRKMERNRDECVNAMRAESDSRSERRYMLGGAVATYNLLLSDLDEISRKVSE